MQTLTLIENQNVPSPDIGCIVPTQSEFNQLLQELRPMLFNYCKRYLRHHEDAEEACQDTILKALQAWSSFEGRASVKTWLFNIARNECANQYRQRGRFDLVEDVEYADEGESTLNGKTEACQFSQLLRKLSVQERNVLSFRFLDDLQLPEIANCMEMNVSTVKMCYYRALDKFNRLQAV